MALWVLGVTPQRTRDTLEPFNTQVSILNMRLTAQSLNSSARRDSDLDTVKEWTGKSGGTEALRRASSD